MLNCFLTDGLSILSQNPPPSPKFIPTPISVPSPVKFIPAPRTMPSPIRTRISNSNSLLPTLDETQSGGERRSMSIGDLPAKVVEQPQTTTVSH